MNDPNIGRVVVEEVDLQQRIQELGKDIASDYADDPPLLVGILKGAFMFMADLARAIDLPVEFDFMAVSSYGSATRTSGVVRIMKDLDLDLTDRHVLIVEDIVDSGPHARVPAQEPAGAQPASLEVCALLVKEGLQKTDPDLKYVGFRIPPDFVIGYGLDVDERYRNLPFVAEYAGVDPSARRLGALLRPVLPLPIQEGHLWTRSSGDEASPHPPRRARGAGRDRGPRRTPDLRVRARIVSRSASRSSRSASTTGKSAKSSSTTARTS